MNEILEEELQVLRWECEELGIDYTWVEELYGDDLASQCYILRALVAG
jgi:hypothetical protein